MKGLGYICLVLMLLASCAKEEKKKTYTQEEVQRVVDSTIKAKVEAEADEYNNDLEIRKAIEVKSRMDSIQKAKMEKPVN